MTEEQKNDPPGNTGGPPKNTGEPPEKKQRKPKTAKQIEAAKRNLAKIGKNKQSKQPEESKAIVRDDDKQSPARKPKKPTEEKKGWNWRFRFHF